MWTRLHTHTHKHTMVYCNQSVSLHIHTLYDDSKQRFDRFTNFWYNIFLHDRKLSPHFDFLCFPNFCFNIGKCIYEIWINDFLKFACSGWIYTRAFYITSLYKLQVLEVFRISRNIPGQEMMYFLSTFICQFNALCPCIEGSNNLISMATSIKFCYQHLSVISMLCVHAFKGVTL